MNYFLLLGPIGMIAIGCIAMILWWKRHDVKPIFFAWGGLLWFIAVIAKAALDFTLTPLLISWLQSALPGLLILIMSIIVGLRTGFFESGISYLMLKNKVKTIKWKDAISIGLGFGGTESIILGALSLTGMLMLMNPAVTASLTEAEKLIVDAQLSQNTLVIFAPWLERFFTLIAHVFASVLVIKAVTNNKLKLLWGSIIYKTILDAPVPLFQMLIANGDLVMTYVVEIYIISMGMVGYYGIKWLAKKEPFTLEKEAKPRKRKSRK